MNASPSIYCAFVKELFYEAVQQGVTIEQLESTTGLKPEHLEDLDTRIALDQHMKLWDAVIHLTRNPALALQLGEKATPRNMGVIGLVIMNCQTLADMFHQTTRYMKLIAETDEMVMEHHGELSRIIYRIRKPEYFNISGIERGTSMALSWIRLFTRQDICPEEVWFQFPPPPYIDEYQRIFKAPIKFNQVENAIILKKTTLSIRSDDYDPYLWKVLNQHAEALYSKLNVEVSIQNQVQELIFEFLPKGEMNVENIAESVCMSSRTLSRRLSQEGTSFKGLVEKTRKKMAENYLRQKTVSINDITFLLGFSELSAFSRAFKRWYGSSPSDYRQTLLNV